MPQQMPPMVGMQRVRPQGMLPYNMASQAGIGGLNPGGMPMQRGMTPQPHQQHQLIKDPGMGLSGYPQQRSRSDLDKDGSITEFSAVHS